MQGCNAARCATQRRHTNASQALRTWVPSRKRPRSAPASEPNDNTGVRSASAGSTPVPTGQNQSEPVTTSHHQPQPVTIPVTSIVTCASTAMRYVASTTGVTPQVPSQSRPVSTSSGISTIPYQLLLTVDDRSVLTHLAHEITLLLCISSSIPCLE